MEEQLWEWTAKGLLWARSFGAFAFVKYMGWEEEKIYLAVPFRPIVLLHKQQVTDEQEIKTRVV